MQDMLESKFRPVGPWQWVILVCLVVKPLLFYYLMNIEINFTYLWVSTALFLILFFSSFHRLWIPIVFYFLFSILMFCDVTFNAYFNGYLSVSMLGSSKYLGDVTDVIIEVIQPRFFLLLIDLPVLIVALIMNKHKRTNKRWPLVLVLVVLIAILVVGSVTDIVFLKSMGNLEFFSYHIKDVLAETTGFGLTKIEEEDPLDYEVDESDLLFGIAEGRNLIVLQMEALQNFVINRDYYGHEITPVLNNLIKDKGTIYFDNYYMQIAAGNTSDAEFATNNSLYGSVNSYTYEIYKNNTFRGLPVLLKERGYSTIAMHGYDGSFWSRKDMYPAQGFDTFIDDKGYKPSKIHGWGILDHEFYIQSVEYLIETPQPFYSFMVSLTNHTPFEMDEELKTIELKDKHIGTRFGNYLNSIAYCDSAVGVLIDELKKAGLYENTVIAIYGDHFGLAQYDVDNEVVLTDFLGKPYRFDEMANIPLIIHIPGEDINQTISIAGGHMDFLPTIAHLLGFEELDTIYLGQNLFTAESGFVIQNRYAPLGSFIADDIIYFMSMDGIFENGKAWKLDTGEAVPIDGLKHLSDRSKGLIMLSEQYLEEDKLAEDKEE